MMPVRFHTCLHTLFDRAHVGAVTVWHKLEATVTQISDDSSIRAIVLASAFPKVFTAGLDITASNINKVMEVDPAREGMRLRAHIVAFQKAISSLEECTQPVIAALHGLVIGLGVDIACACDVRLAASDATFGIKEVVRPATQSSAQFH